MKALKHFFCIAFLIITTCQAYTQELSEAKWGRNMISVNIIELPIANANLGYERLMRGGLIGIKFNMNYNFDASSDAGITGFKRIFDGGIDLNLYPTGQGRIKYFAGPSLKMGRVGRRYYYSNDINGQPTYDYSNRSNYLGLYFNNGFILQPNKWLFMGVQGMLGVGLFKSINTRSTNSFAQMDGVFKLNTGYRF